MSAIIVVLRRGVGNEAFGPLFEGKSLGSTLPGPIRAGTAYHHMKRRAENPAFTLLAAKPRGIFLHARLRFSAALCCVLASTQSERVFAAAPGFQLGDLKRIVSLRDASISPNGKEIAVLVSTPDWKADKSQEDIDIIDALSGARRAVTWKRTWLASPRWSGDGSRLAFLAEDDADERRTQIFVPLSKAELPLVWRVSDG